MSTLLASMMTFSRLSSDSELIALRGCGVSVKRIVVPAVLLSLLITGISFSVQEVVAPASTQRGQTAASTRARRRKSRLLREGNITFQQEQPAEDGSGDELVRFFPRAQLLMGRPWAALPLVDFSPRGRQKMVLKQISMLIPRNLGLFPKPFGIYRWHIYAVSPDGSFRQIISF